MSDDLAAFLKARFDEDEQTAHAATPGRWRVTHDPLGTHVENGDGTGRIVMKSGADRSDGLGEQNAAHIARHDPARVLREVEAKREIVGHCQYFLGWTAKHDSGVTDHEIATMRFAGREILLRLALPHAGHPDYREEWRR